MQDSEPHFLKRIRERRRSKEAGAASPVPNNLGLSLQNYAHIAQIAVVFVAIFGYFYTVQPIYQKERLAEEVAQSRMRLAEIDEEFESAMRRTEEYEIAALKAQEKVSELKAELTQQITALDEIRRERDSIQSQIQFMDFTHHLPDGSPADSAEEVAQVIYYQYQTRFLSGFGMNRMLDLLNSWIDDADLKPFSHASFDYDQTSPEFPFTETELALWEEHGTQYPFYAAIETIKTTDHPEISESLAAGSDVITKEDVDGWEQLAIQYVHDRKRPWVATFDPAEYVEQIQGKLAAIDAELKKNLDNVKPGTFRSINIDTHKRNARIRKLNVVHEAVSEANKLRTSISEEIDYFLDFDELKLRGH